MTESTRRNDNAARERAIIFSASMVRAILAGQKSQTRRIIDADVFGHTDAPLRLIDDVLHAEVDGRWQQLVGGCGQGGKGNPVTCKYGRPGDHLWVRERFQLLNLDGQTVVAYEAACRDGCFNFAHRDGTIEEIRIHKWRTPIYMPRFASRLTLKVSAVDVQRVQDITKEAVIAEGFTTRDGYPLADVHAGWHEPFAQRWEELIGPGSWGANPWVWALTFNVQQQKAAA